MKQELLLRAASMIICEFKDNCRLSDITKSIGCKQSYASHIKKIFIEEDIIKSEIEGRGKRLVLTEKGKLIKSNLIDMRRILNEVNKK